MVGSDRKSAPCTYTRSSRYELVQGLEHASKGEEDGRILSISSSSARTTGQIRELLLHALLLNRLSASCQHGLENFKAPLAIVLLVLVMVLEKSQRR